MKVNPKKKKNKKKVNPNIKATMMQQYQDKLRL